MTRVAVLDDYLQRAQDFADWDSLGPDVSVTYFSQPMTEEILVAALGDFEVLVLMRERTLFGRRILERLPKLELVVTTGMRNAAVDADYLHQRGIAYAGTGMGTPRPGIGATAEVAWALIFATTKRVVIDDRALRAGTWQTGFPAELAGATLGLAGLGRLGAAMVAPAQAFGMDVIAWSSNLTAARAAEVGATLVGKDELLDRSDVLSIHLVLSERSRGLFGAAELARMKPTAVLVNTSRGPIVDEVALVDVLRARRIAGAGLDVFDHEPLPADHPLLSLDNTVLTPHLGYVSERGFRDMYNQVVADIDGFRKGQPIRLIDPAG
jgi:phosphoglycerate dehydrogenase-like enzyme